MFGALMLVTLFGFDVGTTTYSRPELLAEAADVAKTLTAPGVVVLDVRLQKDYEAGHVPGARWVNLVAWGRGFGEGELTPAWQQRLAEVGLANAKRVVIYDDGKVLDAARCWWMLRYWGVPEVALLNGGWKAWTAGQHPVSEETPQPITAQATFTVRQGLHATKADVLKIVKREAACTILDARAPGEHDGSIKVSSRAGAVPGAVNLEWVNLIDKSTGRFKTAAELNALFTAAKIDLTRPVTTHCQSGGRSSVMHFALELMGARDVRNYYKGWSDWGNDPGTPVQAGKK